MKGDVQILPPEVLTPSIVVPADHDDRHPGPHAAQCGGDAEPASRDDPPVGEPEIKEIAVDQKTISQGRRFLQELEEGLLDLGLLPGGPEMGIGKHYELATKHGAKIPDSRCTLQALALFDFPVSGCETSHVPRREGLGPEFGLEPGRNR